MKRITSVALILVLAVLASACAGYTYNDLFEPKGVHVNEQYELRTLEKSDTVRGNIRGSASMFFFVGGGSINGDFEQYSVLKFAFESGEGIVSLVEFPVSKVDFRLDDSKNVPNVQFVYRDGGRLGEKPTLERDTRKSLAENLQNYADSVVITLDHETFNREIAPFIAR